MLRDDRQAALNEVIEACLWAAERHADAAALLLPDEPLARQLLLLATRRRAHADELGRQLQALGDLPGEPTPELTTLQEIVQRVRSALTGDPAAAIRADAESTEDDLAGSVQAALAVDGLPEASNLTLAAILADRGLLEARSASG